MKKYLITTFLIFLTLIGFSQTLLTEDFSNNQMPPSGWSISNYSSQWSINQGNSSGGSTPEAMFTWVSDNSTSHFISPSINTTGKTKLVIDFDHFVDHFSSGYTLALATRSSNGTWHNVWSISPSADVGPESNKILIQNSDVGSSTFQFCFFINGNFYNIDYWYIDNIVLSSPYILDVNLTSISTPDEISDFALVKGVVTNTGINNITNLLVNWQIDNNEIRSTTINGLSIPLGGTYNFSCAQQIHLPFGNYGLKVWIDMVNGESDQNPTDNLLQKNIQMVSHTVNKRPCFEEFTSSTCPPCATFNDSFVPWCDSYSDDITLVKYQMNWPGSGDPYYTSEGGIRRSYYGITWVPWLTLDGSFTDTEINAVENGFGSADNESGVVKIKSSFSQSGTSMNIKTNILPFKNLISHRIFVVVFENLTTGNVGTNGETQFENVMMKMLPSSSGTAVNLADRIPNSLDLTVNLAGTNVEDYNDLGVAIIVQNYGTKKIVQSDYSIKNGSFSNNPQLANLSIDGISIQNFSPTTYDYTVDLPFGTTTIPKVEAASQDPKATSIILQTFELPGTATVQVFDENLQTSLTYNVHFTVSDSYYLDLTAYLEGPFNGFNMDTDLNEANTLPLVQPFNATPWNYSGTEFVSSIPNANVVDWILVELRDASNASVANNFTTITRKAAFILSNGKISDLDGVSHLSLNTPFSKDLYVVLRHRNHLDIMSNIQMSQTGSIFQYNFSDDPVKVYGDEDGYIQIGSSRWGMVAGDGNCDGNITEDDLNLIWYPNAGKSGYIYGDYDLDGQVENKDKNDRYFKNLNSNCQVPE